MGTLRRKRERSLLPSEGLLQFTKKKPTIKSVKEVEIAAFPVRILTSDMLVRYQLKHCLSFIFLEKPFILSVFYI